jgi:hypothetical protein
MVILILFAFSKEEYLEWIQSISANIAKPPSKPPKRAKRKGEGIVDKAKNKIGVKV